MSRDKAGFRFQPMPRASQAPPGMAPRSVFGPGGARAKAKDARSMDPHKFSIGQTVEFLPTLADGNVPRGAYKVTRTMPGDDLDRTYGVRSVVDGHERVVREKQLRPGPGHGVF